MALETAGIVSSNWVLSADQWAFYQSNGINRTADIPGTWCSPPLTINGIEGTDGWQVAAVLVYSTLLAPADIQRTEQWLAARYGLGRQYLHRALLICL